MEVLCTLDKIPSISLDDGRDLSPACLGEAVHHVVEPVVLEQQIEEQISGVPSSPPEKPFQKWMKTLQRRAIRQRKISSTQSGVSSERPIPISLDSQTSAYHRESSSESSFAFVSAVKSVGSSFAGASLLTRSRRNTLRSSRKTDRSSRASISVARASEDSIGLERSNATDFAVSERAIQRRRILEELITTEESYIGDVRFLMNVGLRRAYPYLLAGSADCRTGLCDHSRFSTNPPRRITSLGQTQFDRNRRTPRGDSRRAVRCCSTLRMHSAGQRPQPRFRPS